MIPRDQQRGRSWIYLILVLLLASATALAGTTGNLTGYVQGPNNAPLSGIKVTVTSPVLQGTRQVSTDSQGFFRLTQLPPGDGYRAKFEGSGYQTTERTGVRINIDATIKLPTVMMKPVQQVSGVIEVTEERPVVEQGSTTIGKNMSSEFLAAVPTGRSTTAVLALAPGASSDALGVTFRGATSPENSYVVDGLNTTGIVYGLASSALPPEFIQEIQVKTGGYEPEYGRATGGQAIVITKSGGNEFHGDVFLYATPIYGKVNPTISGADNVLTLNEEAIMASISQPQMQLQAGFDVGGYIIKDKLWFFAGYAPTFTTRTLSHAFFQNCSGKGAAPRVDNPSLPDMSLCADDSTPIVVYDKDAKNYNYDAYNTAVADGSIAPILDDRLTQSHYFLGNMTFNLSPDHAVRLSGSGSPSSAVGALAALGGDPSTYMGTAVGSSMDFSLTYNGKFAGGLVNFDAILGYHLESSDDIPFTGTYANDTYAAMNGQTLDGYQPLVTIARYYVNPSASNATGLWANNENNGVRENAIPTGYEESCLWDDPSDGVDGTLVPGPCVYYTYSEGGYGGITRTSASRLVFKPIVSIFLNNMVGNHVIKLGGDVENNSLANGRAFTGGMLGTVRNSTSAPYRERYYSKEGLPVAWRNNSDWSATCADGNDTANCTFDMFSTESTTLNYSGFIQDNWSVLSNLSINLGLRWEVQKINDVNGITRIDISDNIAPRLGIIFDFTNQGKSKLYANFGRYYESIPHDINDRALSAEGFRYYQFREVASPTSIGSSTALYLNTDNGEYYFPGAQRLLDADGAELTDADGNLIFPIGATGTRSFALGGEQALIQKGLKGQYKDSMILGFEYEVMQDLSVGITGIYETLGRVIEDISPDNGGTYIIANPDADHYTYLVMDPEDPTAASEEVGPTNADGSTDPDGWRRCFASTDPLTGAPVTYCFPTASRTYQALELSASKRFSTGWQGSASYTLSQVYGNYPGLFSSTNGQLDPNITSQFDLASLMVNREGQLDQDRSHNFKVQAAYQFNFGMSLGVSASFQSGIPVYYLGSHSAYGGNEAFLLPRGVFPEDTADGESLKYLPWQQDLDMNARYTLNFNNKTKLTLGAQLTNIVDLVANNQTPARLNPQYTQDFANPSAGAASLDETQCYSYTTYTASVDCQPNPTFGQPTSFAAPWNLRIEAKYSF